MIDFSNPAWSMDDLVNYHRLLIVGGLHTEVERNEANAVRHEIGKRQARQILNNLVAMAH